MTDFENQTIHPTYNLNMDIGVALFINGVWVFINLLRFVTKHATAYSWGVLVFPFWHFNPNVWANSRPNKLQISLKFSPF